MRQFLFILITLTFFSCQQTSESKEKNAVKTTSYYFIRHAEKDRSDPSNKNPNLTIEGHKRAKKWSDIFKHITFDKIYSTNYNRTIQTAQPTANKQNISIQFYKPNNLYSKEFINNTKGKTVLVVGHSNTTPSFVNKVLNEEKYQNINDSVNGNLYIVTIKNQSKTDYLLSIQ